MLLRRRSYYALSDDRRYQKRQRRILFRWWKKKIHSRCNYKINKNFVFKFIHKRFQFIQLLLNKRKSFESHWIIWLWTNIFENYYVISIFVDIFIKMIQMFFVKIFKIWRNEQINVKIFRTIIKIFLYIFANFVEQFITK